MTKKLFILITILLTCFLFYIDFGYNKKPEEIYNQNTIFNEKETKKISELLAHLLYHDLQTFSPHYDFNETLQIMTKIEEGQTKLLPDDECRTALIEFEYRILQDEEHKNLEKLNQFFDQLALKPNIAEVYEGKLYYEIIQFGTGEIISENSTPLIHFTEYDMSNNVLQDTRTNQPKKIKLKETIPGFRQGVVGMHIGEKRKIYIHPDLAYGRVGRYSKPQLIIFDVEVLDSELEASQKKEDI